MYTQTSYGKNKLKMNSYNAQKKTQQKKTNLKKQKGVTIYRNFVR